MLLHYIPHPYVDANSILVFLGFCARMSSANQGSVAHSKNHGDGRDEDPPDQPLMAEFLLASERNKRETNRLLAQIEQNTAHQRKKCVSITDFIGLKPPTK